jgi:hypothetical protein
MTREEFKLTKYSGSHLSKGASTNMISLFPGLGTFWKMGEKANSFLKALSIRSTDENGRKNQQEFMTSWRRRFSIVLQKVNNQVILKKLDGLLSGNNVVASAGWGLQCHVH